MGKKKTHTQKDKINGFYKNKKKNKIYKNNKKKDTMNFLFRTLLIDTKGNDIKKPLKKIEYSI